MWEQAETFCRETLTALAQLAHLKVRVRAGLNMGAPEIARYFSGVASFNADDTAAAPRRLHHDPRRNPLRHLLHVRDHAHLAAHGLQAVEGVHGHAQGL